MCDAHTHTHVHMHTYTHTRIQTYKHTYIHTYMHACMHACIHSHVHKYIQTYIHTHIHTYTHAYPHIYIHTYMHMPALHALIRRHFIFYRAFYFLQGILFFTCTNQRACWQGNCPKFQEHAQGEGVGVSHTSQSCASKSVQMLSHEGAGWRELGKGGVREGTKLGG